MDLGARLCCTRAASAKSSSISFWRSSSSLFAVRSLSSANFCSDISMKVMIAKRRPSGSSMDRALTTTGSLLPSYRGNTNSNRLWPASKPLSLCCVSSSASSAVKNLSKFEPRNSDRGIPVISSKFPLTKIIWGQSSAIISPSFSVSRMPSICSSHSGCSISTELLSVGVVLLKHDETTNAHFVGASYLTPHSSDSQTSANAARFVEHQKEGGQMLGDRCARKNVY